MTLPSNQFLHLLYPNFLGELSKLVWVLHWLMPRRRLSSGPFLRQGICVHKICKDICSGLRHHKRWAWCFHSRNIYPEPIFKQKECLWRVRSLPRDRWNPHHSGPKSSLSLDIFPVDKTGQTKYCRLEMRSCQSFCLWLQFLWDPKFASTLWTRPSNGLKSILIWIVSHPPCEITWSCNLQSMSPYLVPVLLPRCSLCYGREFRRASRF
jgi:hypothetical protein